MSYENSEFIRNAEFLCLRSMLPMRGTKEFAQRVFVTSRGDLLATDGQIGALRFAAGEAPSWGDALSAITFEIDRLKLDRLIARTDHPDTDGIWIDPASGVVRFVSIGTEQLSPVSPSCALETLKIELCQLADRSDAATTARDVWIVPCTWVRMLDAVANLARRTRTSNAAALRHPASVTGSYAVGFSSGSTGWHGFVLGARGDRSPTRLLPGDQAGGSKEEQEE